MVIAVGNGFSDPISNSGLVCANAFEKGMNLSPPLPRLEPLLLKRLETTG